MKEGPTHRRNTKNPLYKAVLVNLGCHNKVDWMAETTLIFAQFRKLEVPDQGPAGFVSSESSLLGLWMAAFSFCVHLEFFGALGGIESTLASVHTRALILSDQGFTLMTSCNPNHLSTYQRPHL